MTMNNYISIKDAANFTGLSETTIRNLVRQVRHSATGAVKVRQFGKRTQTLVSLDFIRDHYNITSTESATGVTETTAGVAGATDVELTAQLHSEIEYLKDEIRTKNEQIAKFQEREKEAYIMLNNLQNRLLISDGAVEDTETEPPYDEPPYKRKQEPPPTLFSWVIKKVLPF